MLELMENISSLLSLYVPGYLARAIFYRLTKVVKTENNGETNDMVLCIVISYLSTTVVRVCVPQYSEAVISLLSIVLSILASIGLSFIWQSKCIKDLFVKTTKTTPHSSIWETILPKDEGKYIRCYIEFNHKKARIEGKAKYYEVDKDGDCRIALTDYNVIYDDGDSYSAKEGVFYMISTKNIQGFEIF